MPAVMWASPWNGFSPGPGPTDSSWLTHDPLKRVVLAFTTALPRHGGTGALYLLLRKFKKVKGKARFEKEWPDFG